MRRTALAALSFLGTAVLVMSVDAQPPGGPGGKDKKGKKDGKGPPPPRFAPGDLFPPGLREELNLTAEQEKAIAAIEKDVKAKLEKLLTAEQKKTVGEFRPGPPMGPPPGGPGGFPGPGGPPDMPPPPREKKDDGPQAKADGGIQWFATLTAGLAEAKRTGKPVLFLSAAPHCGGVPGMW